jgi:hypothetical protein
VVPPEQLTGIGWDALLITSAEGVDKKKRKLSDLGIDSKKIYTLR